MRLLLDTHILVWALLEPHKLSAKVRDLLEDPNNDVLFSAASIWELAIKAQAGRTNFKAGPLQIALRAAETGFTEMPITSSVAARVAELEVHHRDPFDRFLIAQALAEPARLLTIDKQLAPYSELVTLL